MNETLCRALIQARLTEEDVAARLQVDPKTVRRWLEGRVPYLRHRWAIAAMLGADETDLWPQLRTTRTRPDEVIAIYPHRDTVPRDVWLRLFGSAQCEIGILEEADLPVAADQPIADALAERARSGVKMRICLHDTNTPAARRAPAARVALFGGQRPRGARHLRAVTREGRSGDPASSGSRVQLHLLRRRPAAGHASRLRHLPSGGSGPSPSTGRGWRHGRCLSTCLRARLGRSASH